MPGQVVGRISLKVIPDTSNTKRDLRIKLESIERSTKIKVNVEPTFIGLERSILEKVRDINRNNRNTDSRKIRIHTMVESRSLDSQLDKALAKFRDGSDGKLDIGGISKSSLKRLSNQLNDWVDGESPKTVDLGVERNLPSFKYAQAQLANLARTRLVSLIVQVNQASLASATSALAALSGARLLGDKLSGFKSFLSDLDRSIPQISKVSTLLTNLGSGLLAATSNMAAFGASLAPLAGLALPLAGAFGGIALSAKILVTALQSLETEMPRLMGQLNGLKQTALDGFFRSAAVPMQEMANQHLPLLTRQLSRVSEATGTLFASLLTDVSRTAIPRLSEMTDGLVGSLKIATGGTGALARIVEQLGLAGSAVLPRLTGMFVDLQERFADFLETKGATGLFDDFEGGLVVLRQLGSVISSVSRIFSAMGQAALEAGGSSISILAAALDRVASVVESPGFREGMVTTFRAAHDAMDAIVATAGPGLSTFFSGLSNIIGTVLPLAGATLGTALGALGEAFGQIQVQRGVVDFFRGVASAVDALAPSMGPLALAFGSLMEAIGAIAPVIAGTLAAALVPMSAVITAIAPAVAALAQALGPSLVAIITALTPSIISLAGWFGKLATDGVKKLAPKLGDLANWLSARIPGAIAAVKPFLTQTLPKALRAAWDGAEPLRNAISAVAGWLAKHLPAAISTVMPFLTEKLPAAFRLVWDVTKPVRDGLASVFRAFGSIRKAIAESKPSLQVAKEGLLEVWKRCRPLFSALGEIAKVLAKILIPVMIKGFVGAITVVAGFLRGLAKALEFVARRIREAGRGAAILAGVWGKYGGLMSRSAKLAMDTIRGAVDKVTAIVSGPARTAAQALGTAWGTVRERVSRAASGMLSAVSRAVGRIGDKVRSIGGQAISAVANFGSLLQGAGQRLIQGLINGISSKIGEVRQKMGELAGAVKGFFPGSPVKEGPLVSWNDGGAGKRLVSQGLIAGFEASFPGLTQSTRALARSVASFSVDVPRAPLPPRPAAASSAPSGNSMTLNYYAAPGNSITSEQDLFRAIKRLERS